MLVGGTLTQLAASLGTPWAFDPPQGCVLFIEDVGERPYRIDRMLTQLAQAGILARAAGLVFGELPACDEPGGEHAIRDVLQRIRRTISTARCCSAFRRVTRPGRHGRCRSACARAS